MQKYAHWSEINSTVSSTAIALGTFDGVHIGHQQIIKQAVELAAKTHSLSTVFTFSNHPLSAIDPDRNPPQIITNDYKSELIASLGVDILLSIPFTIDFLQLSPQQFIDLMLKYLRPAAVVVGPNYSFGHKGAGTPELLALAGKKCGFEVIIHPAVYIDSILVSSTTIRQMIQDGDVSGAAVLLGRAPRITGPVIAGDGRGKGMGFPTANIAVPEGIVIPANGVYAVDVFISGTKYRGVANIGFNPTFKGTTRRIETYIIGFTGDIYGQSLSIDFLAKLRDETKFDSVDDLKKQITEDVKNSNKYYI